MTQRGEIAAALQIGAGQHDEERRGIDAAVITAERHFAQLGHFAVTHLVQDLAGLGVGGGIEGGRLVGGKMQQDAARQRRIEPQRFQRRDQRVAAEGGAEPGDAGIGVGPFRRLGDQHGEVGDRAPRRLVEDGVRGDDCCGSGDGSAERPPGIAQPAHEADAHRFGGGAVAGDLQHDRRRTVRRDVEEEGGMVRRQLTRRRIEAQPGLPPAAVEAEIGEPHRVRRHHRRLHRAAPRPLCAAYLEHVGEIGGEGEIDLDAVRLLVEITDGDPLMPCAVPQEA